MAGGLQFPMLWNTPSMFDLVRDRNDTSRHDCRSIGSMIALCLAAAVVITVGMSATVFAEDSSHEHGTVHGKSDEHHTEIGHKPPAGVSQEDFESPAEFKRDLAIYSLAVFVLLFGLLSKFAWKPICEGLDKREQGIKNMIASAQRSQDEAKEVLAVYERRVAAASDEVRMMLDEARKDADVTRQTIIAEARHSAEEELARTRREINLATDDALTQISQRAGELAVQVAGKFLREKIGRDDHARLIQDAIAGVSIKSSIN